MLSIRFSHLGRALIIGFALGWSAMAATAQGRGDVGGPAEIPPASYEDQTYVDSRGCVFLRAGYGGTVNWVPRVNAERKALCGYPPTLTGTAAPVEAEVAPPVPLAVVPGPTAAPVADDAPRAAAMARDKAAPRKPRRAARLPRASTPQVAVAVPARCYTTAPVPRQFRTADGGTVILCTRGDGTMDGLRAPVGSSRQVVVAGARPAQPVPPGYKPAWDDGRLNPLRGRGTVDGQASQDTIWTREIPATLVYPSGAKGTRVVIQRVTADPATGVRTVIVTTKGDRRGTGKTYVQVGAFANPTNAENTRRHLRATGLPVGTARDGARQIVLAGPFATAEAADAALARVHRAGFGDAFLR